MKKIFAFLMALTAAVAVNATVVTLNASDFEGVDPAAAIDQTVKDVHVTITNGFINASEVRIYKSQTITIACESPISAIVFTCTAADDAKYGPGCFNAQDGYSYSGIVGTWQGTAATSVSFVAGSNQVRASKIEVYLDGETPAVDTWEADTVSVTEARALIDEADAHDHFVIGVVATELTDQYGSGKVSFFLTDEANDKDSLQAYELLNEENKTWASLDDAKAAIHFGDTILIHAGLLKKYNSIYEATACRFVKVLGANPDAPVETLDTLTAAEALEAAKALEVGKSKKVVINCYIASIKSAWNESYKNISLWLNDDPTSTYGVIATYRTKADEAVGPTLAAGDKVEIVGYLTHETYDKDGETKDSYQVAEGAQLTLLEKAQGIEDIVLTEKVQKVVVDGAVYVVRDGKMFNILGTQVR